MFKETDLFYICFDNNYTMLHFRLFLFYFLIFSFSYSQSIRINEVAASNSIFLDEDGDTPDWIELYNFGNDEISLNNWVRFYKRF